MTSLEFDIPYLTPMNGTCVHPLIACLQGWHNRVRQDWAGAAPFPPARPALVLVGHRRGEFGPKIVYNPIEHGPTWATHVKLTKNSSYRVDSPQNAASPQGEG